MLTIRGGFFEASQVDGRDLSTRARASKFMRLDFSFSRMGSAWLQVSRGLNSSLRLIFIFRPSLLEALDLQLFMDRLIEYCMAVC